MSFLAFLDKFALRKFRRPAVNEVASEISDALRYSGDLICGALCQIAAGMHTDTPGDQRNMAAVFEADVRNKFGDVHRKMDPKLQRELEDYIMAVCKGKRR